jgi:hypothetical protein
MANRQVRNPGQVGRFEEVGRVSVDVPSFAVDTGSAARALANVAGGLSGTLGKLADRAAQREGELAGLSAGAQSGAAYLQARATDEAAAASNRGPGVMVRAPGNLRKIVSDAAVRHGVVPGALLKIAMIESSFNPKAQNPSSSAGGLFQFVDATARQYGLADRFDPEQAADAAARLAKDNAAHLQKVLGRAPTAGELYLAHQQGAGGAAKLLKNPGARAVDVVGAKAVRLNGGSADMTAGAFANLWMSKAGGGASVTDPLATASIASTPLSREPLALRRDGTIRGEAFDDAAASAYAWRMQEGLSRDLFAAQAEFEDDPAGFVAAADKIRSNYLQDEALADPRMREGFDKYFAQRSEAYRENIVARHERRLRDEQEASFASGYAAQLVDIERQAQVLGANPKGDQLIGDQVKAFQASIDGAVASGTLSPAQAEKYKLEVAETAARGRIQGVYDALPTPERKREFALSVLDDWREGEGPLAALPYDTVRGISDSLRRDAQSLVEAARAANKVEAARLTTMIQDDVESITSSGKGLPGGADGLDPVKVGQVLGAEKLADWQIKRERAGRIYDATSGMETQTAEDITERLALLTPKAGSVGFAEQADVFEAAQKKASAVLKARADDPATAVEKAFPEVKQLASEANPQDPASMQALVSARLEAQDAIGVADLAREPLTVAEAKNLARPVSLQQDPKAQSDAIMQLVSQVSIAYGPHAERVLSQVLSVQGIDKEMARNAAAQFRRLSKGGAVTTSDRRQSKVLDETAAAESSARPIRAPITGPVGRSENPMEVVPSPARQATDMRFPARPTLASIQHLKENPQLAPQFDALFGEGAARLYLPPSSGQ